MHHLSVCLWLALIASPEPAACDTKSDRIEKIARHYHEHGMLNGVLLVKEAGEVIYEGAHGVASPTEDQALRLDTTFYLASVSKQFTAVAVMLLVADGELDYHDEISDYLPEFEHFTQGVTVHQLLTHTSGVPDYLNELHGGRIGLTNAAVKKILLEHGKLNFQPGTKMSYSNGGYVLLSELVERVSKQPLSAFLRERVFKPTGMKQTYVRDEPMSLPDRAVGFNLAGVVDDYTYFTTGAGGIYSTVGDLALWDEALHKGALLTPEALQRAFTPPTLADGKRSSYGYGWRVQSRGGTTRLSHLGGNAGCGAYFQRDLESRNTVILLSNCQDSLSMAPVIAIDAVLRGQPMDTLPRIKLGPYLASVIRAEGIEAAEVRFDEIMLDERSAFDLGEEQLNRTGYQFLRAGSPDIAAVLFEFNVRNFPNSSNAYDSLGEALLAQGNRAEAETAYRESLALDPANENARKVLETLTAEVGQH